MSRVVMVNILAVDPAHIARRPTGEPHIDTDARQAHLYLATRSAAGWLLETWSEGGSREERQRMELVADTESLAASIANAVREIATAEEE